MTPSLPPMAYTEFSLAPKPTRQQTLEIVNRFVNHGIDSKQGTAQLNDSWLIGPKAGWCHDYAVTKQWMLSARGIGSQLCECVAPDGEHHLVLIVDGVVLDNLTGEIGAMRYPVVRMQGMDDPERWNTT